MRKHVIGILAAVLGASSAMAAQGSQPNYNAALSAPTANSRVLSKFTSARGGNSHVGTFKLPTQSAVGGSAAHYDARLGSTTFLWAGANTQAALIAPVKSGKIVESAARDYLLGQPALKLSKGAVGNAKMMELHDLGKGPIIARFQQTHDGLEVFGRQMNVMMDRNLKLVATSGYFAPQDNSKTVLGSGHITTAAAQAKETFAVAADRAIALAFADFSGQSLPSSALSVTRNSNGYTVYKATSRTGEIRPEGEQRAKKVYYYLDGAYIPAWYVEVGGRSVDQADSYGYGYVVSANDGKVLFRKDQIDYDFTYRAYADSTGIHQPFDSPLGTGYDPYVGTAPNGNLPRTPAATNLVTLGNGPISTNDPWLPAGATTTTGNNVDAYLDLSGSVDPNTGAITGDGFQPGTADRRANATSNTFDFPYTPDADPSTDSQRNFAVVNQFYVNNWLHDWWYDNGFNEASGNAQTSNFSRGGAENDFLLAEGQDFSGRNNANERTPSDGMSPRQQMYLFDGAVNGEVTINSPAGIGSVPFNTAGFGPLTFDVTGTVVASAPLDGCTPFTNAGAVTGNIVLIDRGTCSFQTKTVNAQNAGATAVILANNRAGDAPGLLGDPTQPAATIGTLSVSQADGQTIRAALTPGPVNARVRRGTSIDRDGTVDIQIIAHEWFHTTSSRLVGDATGLSNQQGGGMGEGWSDFSSMMLTVRPEDRGVSGNGNFEGAYPLAFYAVGDAYFGIRRAPYSTSFTTFPLTFRHISDGVALPTTAPLAFGQNGADNSEVHNTGEIWCNVLWEIYASLLNDPRYSFTQAQERMKSYVIAGLKMTPNAPTMLEARDALLAAARATDATGVDFQLMATAFAKRGMGAGAVAPDRASTTNANAVEDFTALAGRLDITNAALDFSYLNGAVGYIDNDGVLDPGETALLTLSMVNNGTADITTPVVANLTANGDVTFGKGGQLTFPASTAAPIAIGQTVTGTVEVRLNSATQTAQALTLTLTFADSGPTPSSVFEPAPVTFNLFVNYDIQRNARANDDFEQPLASSVDWSAVLVGTGANWTLTDAASINGGPGTGWFALDNTGATDVRLTTPVLQASTGFSIAFDHVFSFEFSGVDPGTTPPTNIGFDGGVLEISADNGATWTDVIDAGGTFAGSTGYNGIVLALRPDGTPSPNDDSAGHPGFVGDSAAIPALDHVVLSFGDAFAGRPVRLRFREVTDNGGTSFGWFVDNVSFTGITNLPFSAIVVENGIPDQPPVANAGPDQTAILRHLVTLDGSASTLPLPVGGGTLTYQWVQTGGPDIVALVGAFSAQPQVVPTAVGTYTFQLTTTDSRSGLTSTDSVNVVVGVPPGGGSFGVLMFLPGLLALALRRRKRA